MNSLKTSPDKHIHFILPFSGRKPVGGFKVVYEYANHLVGMGHQVTITHSAGLYLGVNPNDRPIQNIAKFLIFGVTRQYLPTSWFRLDPKVKTRWVPSLKPFFGIPADVVIATAWETAEWVARYPASMGEKFYLIQHLEDWIAPRERVLATWCLPLQKIVISKWLSAIANDLGQAATVIPNGLDHDAFGVDLPPESRDPNNVLMLHHSLAFKGTAHGLEALRIAKKEHPALKVTLFGVHPPKTDSLPFWVHFELRPTQTRLRTLYNQAAIFLSPSLAEGWALPPAEAMMCGCATVLTDIGGHEYAIDQKTSLLSAPEDARSMAEHMLTLLKDQGSRIQLGQAGAVEMKQYDWNTSAQTFKELLLTTSPVTKD